MTDVEHVYRCDCGTTASTAGELPPGWTVVQLDEGGVEYAYRCPCCA